jgi:GTPase SAR1 family protein
MFGRPSALQQRIKKLRSHLAQENPLLLQVVKSFRVLDGVAYRLGMLDDTTSFTTRVPWWPMISVLGTFSSGKSTFINYYLKQKLQQTGNQAVDDKFTVICYSNNDVQRVLPGLALDADPRFPFYQMSRDLEAVATGEGSRVDSYLQLKTCHSEHLRGKIVIDSPGFDADEQRTATLKISDHIIDLSDLVLVFFDARHPEPGAMQDTLEHLVANTVRRPDANKFLYILNQIDNAAREDNPEEVFGAWQRALAQKGLTAGRFYSVYDLDAAIPIENPTLRERGRRHECHHGAARSGGGGTRISDHRRPGADVPRHRGAAGTDPA